MPILKGVTVGIHLTGICFEVFSILVSFETGRISEASKTYRKLRKKADIKNKSSEILFWLHITKQIKNIMRIVTYQGDKVVFLLMILCNLNHVTSAGKMKINPGDVMVNFT